MYSSIDHIDALNQLGEVPRYTTYGLPLCVAFVDYENKMLQELNHYQMKVGKIGLNMNIAKTIIKGDMNNVLIENVEGYIYLH